MAKIVPIILIEDDPDDQELMEEVFKSLGVENQLKFFYSSMDAYSYLRTTEEKPFLILSYINLAFDYRSMSDTNCKASPHK